MTPKRLLLLSPDSASGGSSATQAVPSAPPVPPPSQRMPSPGKRPSAVPSTPSKEVLLQKWEVSESEEKAFNLPTGTSESKQSLSEDPAKSSTSSLPTTGDVQKRGSEEHEAGAMRSDSASGASDEARDTSERSEAGSEPRSEDGGKTTPAPSDGPDLLRLNSKKKPSAPRDYTGFSEQEAKLLKGMSNESFDYFSGLLKQNKVGQNNAPKQPDFIYQHPEGYTLHPEYRSLQNEAARATKEARAWEEQLIACKEGKGWKPLVGVDGNGNFVYGQEKAPTLQDEEQIRLAMNKCLGVRQSSVERLQSIPQQFQQAVQNDLQAINTERAKRFDWVAKPELLDHELDLGNGQKAPIRKIRQDFVSLFPVYQRNNPGVEVAADLFVALKVKDMQLQAAESQKVVAQTMVQERKQVEPSSSTRQKSSNKPSGKWGIDEFSMDGFPG